MRPNLSRKSGELSCLQSSTVRQLRRSRLNASLALLLLFPLLLTAQTLDIHDAVKTFATLSNTTVTMSGRAELRITGTGDPIPGSIIHLNSPDAWVLMTALAPSQVASTFLNRVRVNGANAVLDSNVRVAQYAQGAMVIPHTPSFSPLEVFDGRYFTGPSRRLNSYVDYDIASLGPMAAAIGSFKLKRGYMATFAQQENGTGVSRWSVSVTNTVKSSAKTGTRIGSEKAILTVAKSKSPTAFNVAGGAVSGVTVNIATPLVIELTEFETMALNCAWLSVGKMAGPNVKVGALAPGITTPLRSH